jgi:UDP-2,3-diacylglucosamine pyrophosphatase LpxH
VMESLCRVMSDDVGSFQNDIWGLFTKSWTDIRFILTVIFYWQKKRSVNMTASMLQERPSTRLAVTKPDIDQLAYKEQAKRANEILIFGHTHRPFINQQENLVNSGSWVTNEDVHNTYVELKDGKPRLFVYGKGEITLRVNISK